MQERERERVLDLITMIPKHIKIDHTFYLTNSVSIFILFIFPRKVMFRVNLMVWMPPKTSVWCNGLLSTPETKMLYSIWQKLWN